jgi:hypothetical protein
VRGKANKNQGMAVRDYIIQNLRWKVAALALAVFTWLSIQFSLWRGGTELPFQDVSSYPVQTLTGPGEPRTFRTDPAEVLVFIRATAHGKRNLDRQGIQVFVNVTDLPDVAGAIREVRVAAPREVEVVYTEPRAVFVESAFGLKGSLTNSLSQP